jgi:hypothetical protein
LVNGFIFVIFSIIFSILIAFGLNFFGFVLSNLYMNFSKGFLHITVFIFFIAAKYALTGTFSFLPYLHLLKAFIIFSLSILFNKILIIFSP